MQKKEVGLSGGRVMDERGNGYGRRGEEGGRAGRVYYTKVDGSETQFFLRCKTKQAVTSN